METEWKTSSGARAVLLTNGIRLMAAVGLAGETKTKYQVGRGNVTLILKAIGILVEACARRLGCACEIRWPGVGMIKRTLARLYEPLPAVINGD